MEIQLLFWYAFFLAPVVLVLVMGGLTIGGMVRASRRNARYMHSPDGRETKVTDWTRVGSWMIAEQGARLFLAHRGIGGDPVRLYVFDKEARVVFDWQWDIVGRLEPNEPVRLCHAKVKVENIWGFRGISWFLEGLALYVAGLKVCESTKTREVQELGERVSKFLGVPLEKSSAFGPDAEAPTVTAGERETMQAVVTGTLDASSTASVDDVWSSWVRTGKGHSSSRERVALREIYDEIRAARQGRPPARARRVGGAAASRRGSGRTVVVCAALMVLGLTMFVGALNEPEVHTSRWMTTEGSVRDADFRWDRPGGKLSAGGYRPYFTYSYSVGGQQYGTNMPVPSPLFLSESEVAAARRQYQPGAQVTVHYDADRPEVSVLDPRRPGSNAFVGFLMGGVAIVSAIVLVVTLVRRKIVRRVDTGARATRGRHDPSETSSNEKGTEVG